MNKLISIVTPTYNRSDLLKCTIESVLNQTYENWEHIIIDNGSNDTTKEIVNSYQSHDERIKYHYVGHTDEERSSINTGAVCKQYGTKETKGDFITYLDDDNIYYPHRLQAFLTFFEKNPDIDIAYCGQNVKKMTNDKKRCTVLPDNPIVAILMGQPFDLKILKKNNLIDTNSVMLKRKAKDDIHWDETLEFEDDWQNWLQLADKGYSFAFCEQILGEYLAHRNSQISHAILDANND